MSDEVIFRNLTLTDYPFLDKDSTDDVTDLDTVGWDKDVSNDVVDGDFSSAGLMATDGAGYCFWLG
jgi:hypothetical protein